MAKKAASKPAEESAGRGGRRAGSGKASYFRGKSVSSTLQGEPQYDEPTPAWSVRLTQRGYDEGQAALERINAGRPKGAKEVSRNVFVEALIRAHGKAFTFARLRAVADVVPMDQD